MANKQTIRIESILGGRSLDLINIAPDQQIECSFVDYRKVVDEYYGLQRVGGFLSPLGIREAGATGSLVRWIKSNPKTETTYVYDAAGSVYAVTYSFSTPPTVTGVGDLNDGGSSTGNGSEYYDNYMYFARDTTIARYGPLNGTPSFTDDFWVTTLGKAALTNTSYPDNITTLEEIPNHVLHRHSDGRLYIADVVDGRGTLHYIKTTKTTVEGDTDAGSKYDALDFGYGLYPTCMASYGDSIVIGLVESADIGNTTSRTVRTKNAKLAFWDTTSDSPNFYVWENIPMSIIVGLVNLSGTLYILTSDTNNEGHRIFRYIGGESVEEIFFSTSYPPTIGSFVAGREQIYFGATALDLSFGRKSSRSLLFAASATALTGDDNSTTGFSPLGNEFPIFASGLNGSLFTYRTDLTYVGAETSSAPRITFGPFRFGQSFKVSKIRFCLAEAVTSNLDIRVYLAKDGEDIGSPTQGTLIDTISNTSSYTGKRKIVLRPVGYSGEESFCLKFFWDNNSILTPILLPILIDVELYDD